VDWNFGVETEMADKLSMQKAFNKFTLNLRLKGSKRGKPSGDFFQIYRAVFAGR